ncbi:DedA family protein [Ornithinimicrobium cerasi]|uniref:DedA family protein n=1 Tax=Ornithinimicrobium cerasi TaxID=2248773 RepID=UPI001379EB74|nr:VTT domain-containing protein [Ornithinimicrobium cerasi]
MSSYPFAVAFAVLWCAAMARGQATYWIARTVTEQTLRRTSPGAGWRARVHQWLSSDAMDRGRGAIERCGLGAVPLAYLTVGVQTVILASAGVLRMRWLRFTLAQSLGAILWATIYSTVGFAVWATFFRAALAGGPWLVGTGAVALTLVVALAHRGYVVHRRRAHAAYPTPGSAAAARGAVTPAGPSSR